MRASNLASVCRGSHESDRWLDLQSIGLRRARKRRAWSLDIAAFGIVFGVGLAREPYQAPCSPGRSA